jgi:hypothetical protein
MFRWTEGDIMKKCSGAAVAKTTNDGSDHDIELDTYDGVHCHVLHAVAGSTPTWPRRACISRLIEMLAFSQVVAHHPHVHYLGGALLGIRSEEDPR